MKERCEDCKGLEEEIYWKHFQSMQFCQFLTGDSHSQLMIPEKFSKKLGEKLRQKLGLRGPSGTNWDVELMEIGDELYLGNGWGNFVEAHSLAEKDILIFKYSGDSQFDVLMFEGSNLCEKESSYFVRKCGHTKNTEDGSNTPRTKEISMELIQEHAPIDTVEIAFEKKNTLLSDKGKSMRKASDEPDFGGAEDEFSPNSSQVWQPVKLQADTNEKITGFKQISMRKGKSTTHQSSDFYDKENDRKRGYGDEPEFAGAEDEFSQNPSQVWESVKLPGSKQIPMGEGTSTPYHLSYASNQRPVTEAVNLPGSKRIPIREEDEFDQNPSHVWEPVKLPGSAQTPEVACARNELSPTPARVWEPVKLPGSKRIPMSEGKSTAYQKFHFNEMKNAFDHEPEFAGAEDEFSHNPSQAWEPLKLPGSKRTPTAEGTSTPYRLTYASKRRPVTEAVKLPGSKIPMREGKSTTYHNSHFKASDDEPKFTGAEDEFGQNPSQVWEPVKLPGSKQAPMGEGTSTAYHLCYASNPRTVTGAQKVAAMKLASKELSESEGSFLVVMRSTHVSKRFYMAIPAEWATATGVQVRQDVILRTKGRTWKTKLIFSATGRGGLSRGWKDFAFDNGLEEFDVCVFKLASQNQKPVVLDVSIFKVVPEPEVAPQTHLTHEPSSSSQGGSAANKRKFSQLENDVFDVL